MVTLIKYILYVAVAVAVIYVLFNSIGNEVGYEQKNMSSIINMKEEVQYSIYDKLDELVNHFNDSINEISQEGQNLIKHFN